MMKQEPIIRDERFYAVENASYRIGFLILAFGTMGLVVIRSILFQQSYWDFFGLVVFASIATTIYQSRQKIHSYSVKTFLVLILVVLIASVIAGGTIFLIKITLIK